MQKLFAILALLHLLVIVGDGKQGSGPEGDDVL